MDKLIIRYAKGRAAENLIEVVFKSHLYNSGIYGGIYNICREVGSDFEMYARRQHNWFQICVAYLNGKPVGVCITDENKIVHCYVKRFYRNRNIGRMLIQRLKRRTTHKIYGHNFTNSSEAFYTKLKLKIKYT